MPPHTLTVKWLLGRITNLYAALDVRVQSPRNETQYCWALNGALQRKG